MSSIGESKSGLIEGSIPSNGPIASSDNAEVLEGWSQPQVHVTRLGHSP